MTYTRRRFAQIAGSRRELLLILMVRLLSEPESVLLVVGRDGEFHGLLRTRNGLAEVGCELLLIQVSCGGLPRMG